MPNFDFNAAFSLIPLRFQQFACAVVSRREGMIFQRFGAGKDGGIDGLASTKDGRIIIQAKCTETKGRELLRVLKREAKKAEELECSRYILVLSSKANPDKAEIRLLFSHIKDDADIITGVDLNGYLELPEYADIEFAYPELWLCSGNQLEKMLSDAVLKRIKSGAAIKWKQLQEVSPVFVSTPAFFDAIRILENNRRVIISGAPGAGKTTHALCIANYYLSTQGYKALYFVNSLEEIEQILGLETEKTVVVFDDFWGHSSFTESRLVLNFERKLAELFAILEYYPDVRLIFTTREFVLQQGLAKFPELEKVCGLDKIRIELNTYSLAQKAEILYRYADQMNLEYDYIAAIFEKGDSIVHCGAYSPRSVSYFLKHIRPEKYSAKHYAAALYDFVRHPEESYEELFREISAGAKWICVLLVLSEEEIRVNEELKTAFMQIADGMPTEIRKLDYENYLRELDGVFTEIRESSFNEELVIDFLNYSIRDFMKDYITRNITSFEDILVQKVPYFNLLYYLIEKMHVSRENQKRIIERFMTELDTLKFTYTYSMDVDACYDVNHRPEAYRVHKFWELYRLYRVKKDQELYCFITDYCSSVCRCLHEGVAGEEVMGAAVDLIPKMWETGFKLDWESFLEDYYKNIRWCENIWYMDLLAKYCKEIYEKFQDRHYEDIRQLLPGLIFEDIDYYLDDPKWEWKIENLFMHAEELFHKYNLPYDEKLERKLYEAAEMEMPKRRKSGKKSGEDQELSAYEREQMQYDQLTQMMQKILMPDIRYLSPKQIKERERSEGKDYRRGYLTRGKFQQDDFEIVMDYLRTLTRIPAEKEQFYAGLTEYILDGEPEYNVRILENIARKLAEENIFFFSEQTLKKVWKELEDPQIIEHFAEKHILNQSGKWYHFWNEDYRNFLAAGAVRRMNEAEKNECYLQK